MLAHHELCVVNRIGNVAVEHQHVCEFEVVNRPLQAGLHWADLILCGQGGAEIGVVDGVHQRGADPVRRCIESPLGGECIVRLLDLLDDGGNPGCWIARRCAICRRKAGLQTKLVAYVLSIARRLGQTVQRRARRYGLWRRCWCLCGRRSWRRSWRWRRSWCWCGRRSWCRC